MKLPRIICVVLSLFLAISMAGQSITFAVDEVEPASKTVGWKQSGAKIAKGLHHPFSGDYFSEWEPDIIANSFAEEKNMCAIGEDVVFQMLLKAWCQHRPVTLTPDAIWLVICQQFSHAVNKNPENYRKLLVNHDGQKTLRLQVWNGLLSDQADWEGLMARFAAEIGKYTNNDIATKLVADFSTTGSNELIASEVTLMDVVKPFFKYEAFYIVCGIPSITLTGTPEDWRKVLDKTRTLSNYGFDWWVKDLEPILEEFVKASEGQPDISFWKDIVKKTRPQTIQGPTCSKKQPKMTKFDGWFLKLFPFDNDGRTPSEVTISKTMLAETVCVPLKYDVLSPLGGILKTYDLELVAGVVGVVEDPVEFTLTPKIGWFVRTVKSEEIIQQEKHKKDSILNSYLKQDSHLMRRFVIESGITNDSTIRYWSDGPLSYADYPQAEYGISSAKKVWKDGNTKIIAEEFRSFMYKSPYQWAPEFRTPSVLQFFQAGFDNVEICARRIQQKYLESTIFLKDYDFSNPLLNEADSVFARMNLDSRQGQKADVVQHYADSIKRELTKTKALDYKDFAAGVKGFGGGMHFGFGSKIYTGLPSDYLTPLAGLDFGFDLWLSKVNIFLDGLIGWGGGLKKDIPRDGYKWNAGARMKGGSLSASLGYTVHDSQWWGITPYAGVGVGFIDYPITSADTQKNDEIRGTQYQFGFLADYKLYRVLSLLPPFKTLKECSIRTNCFVAYSSYPFLGPSWTINLGISVNLVKWVSM